VRFKIIQFNSDKDQNEKNIIYLSHSSWDDWFAYATLFSAIYIDNNRKETLLGSIKIGKAGLPGSRNERADRIPDIPEKFDKLDSVFFSVGQDSNYYSRINKLGDKLRDEILSALNDMALNEDTYKQSIKYRVTRISLLRDVTPTSIQGHYRRLAMGNSKLSSYKFSYTSPENSKTDSFSINFSVEPESNPPTNIHIIIGRNGVGKTHLLNNMINAIVKGGSKRSKHGYFESNDYERSEIFSSVVSVTFSAFDETEQIPERKDKTTGINYSYIGLKRQSKNNELLPPKTPTILKNEFIKGLELCIRSSIVDRWRRAMKTLESDPIFEASEVSKLADLDPDDLDFQRESGTVFNRLSSGHKIVLLTITKLVEKIEERSLVLLDEPEAHLHPPLLSAFIRVLSTILIEKNGVGIIATHSPVVLQEVPKSCVWKLRRNGASANAEHLQSESFGENVGLLTREVFGLEVTHSGFHKLVSDATDELDTFDEVLASFNNELGMEAQVITHSLLMEKNSDDA
jgi:predicted ATPase